MDPIATICVFFACFLACVRARAMHSFVVGVYIEFKKRIPRRETLDFQGVCVI